MAFSISKIGAPMAVHVSTAWTTLRVRARTAFTECFANALSAQMGS
jgi:hypothetical protein